ncbi:MAG: diguanylate cyclase [Gammaproteobacteria bacterium]|nr:diguanylate cyclase [Gammaproteobacteria bacterium]
MRIRSKRILIIFFELFSIPALLLLGLTYWMFQFDMNNSLKLIQQNSVISASSQKSLLESKLSVVTGDIMFLSGTYSMKNLLHTSDHRQARQNLAEDLKLFAEHRAIYDQVRYLDLNGMEIVRINYADGKAGIVEEAQLQSKKDRYYFRDSAGLIKGAVYIASVDLNVEHGEIERPFKPVLRIAAPVFDAEDNRQGIVILNYLASKLFKVVDKLDGSMGSISMMVNREGYWVKGKTPEDEWGFILTERKHKTMANLYPEVWGVIQQAERGQLTTSEGIFTFVAIRQKWLDGGMEEGIHSPHPGSLPSLTAILHTPASVLRENARKVLPRYIIPSLLLLLVWTLVCFFMSRSSADKEEDRQKMDEKDMRIRSIIDVAFDSIITINQRGIIESFNPAACKLFGYLGHEVIGQKINMLMTSPDREYHDTYLRDFVGKGTGNNINKPLALKALRRDGVVISVIMCIGARKIGNDWLFTGICRDNTEHEEDQNRLKEMATRDALTGIYNRRFFNEQVMQEFNRAKRYNSDLSIMILDIDHFKTLNDEKGHQAGDYYLVQFAALLKQASRSADIVARYGGDEFVMVLPHTSLDKAIVLADRIRLASLKLVPEQEDTAIINTVSVGVAAVSDRVDSFGELILEADQALYQAKRAGRNQCSTGTTPPPRQ